MSTGLEMIDIDDLALLLECEDEELVRRSAGRHRKHQKDLALLLSKGADGVLEELAKRAHRISLARFGRAMQLYAPLYISNHCVGSCPYCGFRADKKIKRRNLGLEEVAREGSLLVQSGIRHVLVVSGEDPRRVDIAHLEAVIKKLKEIVPSVSIEVPPLGEEDYKVLASAGLDGVTLYQETYHPELYAKYHDRGPKADFEFRLGALDRAGKAGIHKLTIGALWGLAPWRVEAFRLGSHAAYLQKKHWRSQVSIGLPRLKEVPPDFEISYPVDDRSLTHIIVGLKVFLEDVGLVLSTREPAGLREKLVPLGITQMSAGSKTEPGGYGDPGSATDQFPVSDERDPKEVAAALLAMGYDPVWKDWERTFGRCS